MYSETHQVQSTRAWNFNSLLYCDAHFLLLLDSEADSVLTSRINSNHELVCGLTSKRNPKALPEELVLSLRDEPGKLRSLIPKTENLE